MKKIIIILFGILAWCACEDETEPLNGPEGSVSEFTDTRDGKTYRCVTIGNQTWMAENLAYRLPKGSVDGCYTYYEGKIDTGRLEPTWEQYKEAMKKEAAADGRLSKEPYNPAAPFFGTIADMSVMYLDYVNSISAYHEMLNQFLVYTPGFQSTLDVSQIIIGELKADVIIAKAAEYFESAEEDNGQYADKYGLLYTYDAARKALPEGWRLPTDEDWKELETQLLMDQDEIGVLEDWRSEDAARLLKEESTGFGIQYGGTRAYGNFGYGSPYQNKELNAYFWSSSTITQNDSIQTGIVRAVSRMYPGILRGTSNLTAAYSIRCIKE